MKVKLLALSLLLALASGTRAQTAGTTPAAPFSNAWAVSVNGNFTSLANSPTNNGVLISTAINLSTHWNLRADTYLLNAPAITIVLGGPEYRLPLTSIFKTQTGAINPANVTMFVNMGAGDAHSTAILSQSGNVTTTSTISKFAYSVGGGFDIALSPAVSIRPLDVKYIRSSMITNGGQIIGNHLDFAAGLGLRF